MLSKDSEVALLGVDTSLYADISFENKNVFTILREKTDFDNFLWSQKNLSCLAAMTCSLTAVYSGVSTGGSAGTENSVWSVLIVYSVYCVLSVLSVYSVYHV